MEGLLYQIDVKLLAQGAGASAVINLSGVIHVKLPYLAEIDREALQASLGNGARVSRTAVMLPAGEDWQMLLLELLTALGQGMNEGTGL